MAGIALSGSLPNSGGYGAPSSGTGITLGGVSGTTNAAGTNQLNGPGNVVLNTNSGNSTVGQQITTPTAPTTTTTSTGPTAAEVAAANNFNNEQASDMGVINTAIGTAASGYGNDIQGLVTQNQNSQAAINAQAVQNELAEDQGTQSVNDMVNNGIEGGGVVLDNDNAGTSSAADALARAYGVQARQSESQVGNQFAQGEESIGNSQSALGNTENYEANTELPYDKTSAINNIVSNANSSLQYLDLLASESGGTVSIPNINTQRQQVQNQATAALSALDGQIGGVTPAPTSNAQNESTAQGLFTAGTAPAQAFNYTDTAPATLASGPAASNLPIYIAPVQSNNNSNTIPQTV